MIARLFGRRRLEQSFALSSALLVVVAVSAITLIVDLRIERALTRGLEARAQSIAQSIGAVATPSLLAYNYPALQIAAEGAVGDVDIRYVVIHDKEGRIAGIAGTPHDDLAGEASLRGGVHTHHVRDPATGTEQPVLEVGVPVLVEGAIEPWGTVRVGLDYDVVTAELRRMEVALVLVGLVIAFLAVAAARWTAQRINAPLRRLARATEALSQGDLSHRIPVSGARELAELAAAFNVMMDRVQEKAAESQAYQVELAQLNATLEQQVEERTRALRESEEQYRSLVEHSPESILIVQDDVLRFVNPSFERTFGIPAHRALAEGFRLASLFDSASADRLRERIAAWTLGERAGSVEVLARDASGGEIKLELRGSRIDYRGRPAAACLLVDITDAQQLREQLEDSNRLRALGELSSGVAHDFNNLLGAILGRVQLLRRREMPERIDRDLEVIEQAAQDGRETVLRIQEFSRTRVDRPFSPVDLAAVVGEAVEITRSRWKTDAQRSGITIALDLQLDEVPTILGSRTELREVITNLILNAVDAMPRGGRLGLGCRRDGDAVCVVVEDDGTGMSEAVRRRLFDPFFTTKGVSGTGMGLSIAYGIVKRHGGNIEVASEPGRGTRFTLDFPSHVALVSEAGDAPSGQPDAVREPARILVIDDERPIAELLADTLVLDGHRVDTAPDGASGLDLATSNEYELVLTDLGMPDMSGWEVTQALHRGHPRLPVILVTGWGTTIGQDEIVRNGVAAIVHKPFELKLLLEVVHRVLDQSRGARVPVGA